MIDTIQIAGEVYSVKIDFDNDIGCPWEFNDCHGAVSDLTSRDKRPSEMILCEYRRMRRYYDFAESCRIARTKWGINDRKAAADAAMADFKRLRAWCNEQWHYVVIGVEDDEGNAEYIGGVESDCEDYIEELAKELARNLYESKHGPQPDLFDKE